MNALPQLSSDEWTFRQIVESVDVGIWKVSASGQTDYVNSRLARMLGYKQEELLGRSLFDLIAPSERSSAILEVTDDNHGSPQTFQRRFVRKNGELRWFSVTSTPLMSATNEFLGRLGVLSDITDRLALEEERDRFFTDSLDMLGIAGVDTFFKRLNPAFEKTLGWKTEELMERSYLDFIHPDDLIATGKATENVANGIHVTEFENRYRCKDGSYKWLSWKSRATESGIVYFVARDVTEQKNASEALQRSAEMQAALSDLGQLALKVSDLQLVFDLAVELSTNTLKMDCGAIVEFLSGAKDLQQRSLWGSDDNESLRKLLNYQAAEALGRRRPVIFERSEISRDMASGFTVIIEGFERPFGVLGVFSKKHGKIEPRQIDFLSAMAHIVSTAVERRRLEGQLKISDRMASVGVLAAGVAHEINNPLSYVITNLDRMASNLDGDDQKLIGRDEFRTMITQAQEGAERVRMGVKDLKTFSGPGDERLEVVDLRKVVDFSVRMAGNHMKYRAKIVTDFKDAPYAYANEARLGQVILNILINAAQAIPEGNLEGNQIRISLDTDEVGRAVIEIRDSGVGIPEDILPRIFDPFFTTKPIGVGTGLGLSICRSIIVNLHGTLAIESKVGFGTTVRVTLPPARRQEPPAVVGRSTISAELPHVRRRILIIDDEALLVETLGQALSVGHEVVTTTSPREALLMLEQDQTLFDVIFCDLMMAEMTGMDFYKEIMSIHPGLESRVILMTGGIFTDQARLFLESVPNVRIEKPFNLRDIRNLLQTLPHPKDP